jgi:hypothetical protein
MTTRNLVIGGAVVGGVLILSALSKMYPGKKTSLYTGQQSNTDDLIRMFTKARRDSKDYNNNAFLRHTRAVQAYTYWTILTASAPRAVLSEKLHESANETSKDLVETIRQNARKLSIKRR